MQHGLLGALQAGVEDQLGSQRHFAGRGDACCPGLSVYFATVPNLHHQDTQGIVLDVANYPAVAYPVTPETAKRSGQCFAGAGRVLQVGNAFIHVIEDVPCRLFVEFAPWP